MTELTSTSFDSLGLSDSLMNAINDKGYTTPSPIQAQAIPAVLSGRDVLAAAQTGTGKTAGFTLPLLQKLSEQSPVNDKRPLRALIMVPTRELAAQVEDSVKTYGAHLKLRSTVVFGGVKIKPQINKLRKGVDILVATPGRLLDLQGQGAVNLSEVETLILDEADRMLDMGFIHDIRKILKLLSKKRQNLLFSATFSKGIRDLTKHLLKDPISIDVAPRNTAAETVKQQVYRIDKRNKPELLKHLIKTENWEQALVFTRTKHGANRLGRKLEQSGITAVAIHGNKSQGARTQALADFKAGLVRVMVATDIAARGLDIKQLPHVVNYELPNVPEDYVHRIGRTGRAGSEGHAVSLVSDDEVKLMKGIERLLKQQLSISEATEFVPKPPAKREPESEEHSNRNGDRRKPHSRKNKKSNHRTGNKTTKKAENKSNTQDETEKAENKSNTPNKIRKADNKSNTHNKIKKAGNKNNAHKKNKKSDNKGKTNNPAKYAGKRRSENKK